MTDRTSSRLAGAFFVLLGAAFIAWVEYEAHTVGRYVVTAAFLGPFAVVFGLGLAIHAPTLPIRGGRRETAYSALAAACGLANLYRHGAFSEGSEARWPILVGVGAVAAFSLYDWLKKRITT